MKSLEFSELHGRKKISQAKILESIEQNEKSTIRAKKKTTSVQSSILESTAVVLQDNVIHLREDVNTGFDNMVAAQDRHTAMMSKEIKYLHGLLLREDKKRREKPQSKIIESAPVTVKEPTPVVERKMTPPDKPKPKRNVTKGHEGLQKTLDTITSKSPKSPKKAPALGKVAKIAGSVGAGLGVIGLASAASAHTSDDVKADSIVDKTNEAVTKTTQDKFDDVIGKIRELRRETETKLRKMQSTSSPTTTPSPGRSTWLDSGEVVSGSGGASGSGFSYGAVGSLTTPNNVTSDYNSRRTPSSSGGSAITPGSDRISRSSTATPGSSARNLAGSSPGSSPGKVSKSLRANQAEAYRAARADGLSDKAAKALVANMTGEGLRTPSAYNKDYNSRGQFVHMARGIAQWDPERSEAIRKHFGKYPNEMSVADQTRAMIWEAKTNPRFAATKKALENGSDSDEILETLVRDYEHPAFPDKEVGVRKGHLARLANIDKETADDSTISTPTGNLTNAPATPKGASTITSTPKGTNPNAVKAAEQLGTKDEKSKYSFTDNDQMNRPDYMSGKMTINGKEYQFGSGDKYGRGSSIPYGSFKVTPDAVGNWGKSVGALGINDGVIYDPKLKRNRSMIEFHPGTDPQLLTQGCMSFAGSDWPEVKKQILDMQAKYGTVYLHVGKGGAVVTPASNPDQAAVIEKGGKATDSQSYINTPSGSQTTGGVVPQSSTPKGVSTITTSSNQLASRDKSDVSDTTAINGVPRLKVVGHAAERGVGDERITNILREASKYLPEGYRAEVYSGIRPGDPRFHGKGMANDVRIVGPDGQSLANYQDPTTFRAYERYAQAAKKIQSKNYPELDEAFRWGGYFSGGKGKYGAMDVMHFDIGGKQVGMAGGSWEKGLTENQKKIWGGAPVSEGMGDVNKFALPSASKADKFGETTDKTDIYKSPKNPFLSASMKSQSEILDKKVKKDDTVSKDITPEPVKPITVPDKKDTAKDDVEVKEPSKEDSKPAATSVKTSSLDTHVNNEDIGMHTSSATMAA